MKVKTRKRMSLFSSSFHILIRKKYKRISYIYFSKQAVGAKEMLASIYGQTSGNGTKNNDEQ